MGGGVWHRPGDQETFGRPGLLALCFALAVVWFEEHLPRHGRRALWLDVETARDQPDAGDVADEGKTVRIVGC